MDSNYIIVEVAYALPDRQFLKTLRVEAGVSARQAIELSGILQAFPEIDLETQKLGIFSRIVDIDTPLREGDRVEIYRPLIIDPKEIRRQRAQKNKPD